MQATTTTTKLITSIEVLPLSKFIDCACDNKYGVLILQGEPSQADLLEAWSNLYAQYLDLLEDYDSIYLLLLQKDCELLRYKIVTTEAIVKVLEFFHVEQLLPTLKRFGFDTRNLKMGDPSYKANLKKILSKLPHLKLQLTEKEHELQGLASDQSDETVSRMTFQKQLARLSKFMGYQLRPTKLMMPEYVGILKEYLSQFKTSTDGQEG